MKKIIVSEEICPLCKGTGKPTLFYRFFSGISNLFWLIIGCLGIFSLFSWNRPLISVVCIVISFSIVFLASLRTCDSCKGKGKITRTTTTTILEENKEEK